MSKCSELGKVFDTSKISKLSCKTMVDLVSNMIRISIRFFAKRVQIGHLIQNPLKINQN